jgi:hypothetical protein
VKKLLPNRNQSQNVVNFFPKQFQILSIFKGKRKYNDGKISNFHFSHFVEISHQKNVPKFVI